MIFHELCKLLKTVFFSELYFILVLFLLSNVPSKWLKSITFMKQYSEILSRRADKSPTYYSLVFCCSQELCSFGLKYKSKPYELLSMSTSSCFEPHTVCFGLRKLVASKNLLLYPHVGWKLKSCPLVMISY